VINNLGLNHYSSQKIFGDSTYRAFAIDLEVLCKRISVRKSSIDFEKVVTSLTNELSQIHKVDNEGIINLIE
jgi:hypothetical protein